MKLSRPHNLRHRLRTAAAREALGRAGPILDRTIIALDYPPSAANLPRYAAPHPKLAELVKSGEARYRRTLATIGDYAEDLAGIEVRGADPTQPSWINGFLPGLDGASIYALLRSLAPERYVEVGSGNSTRFAHRAKADGGLSTTITSIDPAPRAEVSALCDIGVRKPLESLDLSLWADVKPGDMIFIDGSHRVFMNSDVVAFFLDVLPSLPAGVLVGVHDVYLPYDYPQDIADRYYSEQYVLAAYLLGGAGVEIVLPAHYVFMNMRAELDALWAKSPRFAEIEHHGVAFWLQT
ncbi:MAG: class I SAM-dependent methyltransferase [Actinomycetota bacterium]|nr:class I SAM-dependent methyltransferase [Actinomycetota bacterium]